MTESNETRSQSGRKLSLQADTGVSGTKTNADSGASGASIQSVDRRARYEVFYGSGGHCGPFDRIDDAAAHGLNNHREDVVCVAKYDANGVSGYLPINLHWQNGGVFAFHLLRPYEIPTAFKWLVAAQVQRGKTPDTEL